jgi:hypothetical protein
MLATATAVAGKGVPTLTSRAISVEHHPAFKWEYIEAT